MLTVDLNEPAIGGSVIVVNDMNGRTVFRRRIKADANQVKVPSSDLHNGSYIYTMLNVGNEPQTGKLIVG